MSHNQAGYAEIDKEIFSEANQQFVLPDSRGFEGDEVGNLKIVKNFIDKRNEMPDIKDKIHAIWYAPMLHSCHLRNDLVKVVLMRRWLHYLQKLALRNSSN